MNAPLHPAEQSASDPSVQSGWTAQACWHPKISMSDPLAPAPMPHAGSQPFSDGKCAPIAPFVGAFDADEPDPDDDEHATLHTVATNRATSFMSGHRNPVQIGAPGRQ